jgi:hypothetical protein
MKRGRMKLHLGALVEILPNEDERPGRELPAELGRGMIGRIVGVRALGTNGEAVELLEVQVGGGVGLAVLHEVDVHPIPRLRGAPTDAELQAARSRYEDTEERSISDRELAQVRSRKLERLVTPADELAAKAKAEAQRARAEVERLERLAKAGT